jgi:hypothetical protein
MVLNIKRRIRIAMKNKIVDKLKMVGIITILIIVVGLILSIIGVEIYVWIEYGNKPITEIPSWALWFMFGGNSK